MLGAQIEHGGHVAEINFEDRWSRVLQPRPASLDLPFRIVDLVVIALGRGEGLYNLLRLRITQRLACDVNNLHRSVPDLSLELSKTRGGCARTVLRLTRE